MKLDKDDLKRGNSFFGSLRFATRTIAVCSVLALVLATGMVFISPVLALMIYALTGMALFFGNSMEERKEWEDKARNAFQTLQRRYDNLVLQVDKNKGAISGLSREVERVAEKLEIVESEHKRDRVQMPSFQELVRKADAGTKQGAKAKKRASGAETKKPELAYKKGEIPVQVVANDQKRAQSYNDTLSDIVVHELLTHAVKDKDIALFMQPIVRLPAGETKFYEVFGRIRAREGAYISAARYMKFAREDKVLGAIDQQVLLHSLKALRERASGEDMPSFFLNIESASLRDMQFMDLLLAFLAKNRTLAQKLVLEIPQAEFENRDHKTGKILQGLRALGCAFSLDHVENMNMDVVDLVKMRVRFVKIPAMTLAEKMQNQRSLAAVQKLKRQLETNGIGVIAERVENLKVLDGLSRYHLNYAQGYLFGRPDTQQHYSLRRAA